MKKVSKYNIYIKSKKVIDLFPQKIKYFHSSKWKFINKQSKQFRVRRYKFKNFFFCKFVKGRQKFIKMKKYYKECVTVKNQLLQVFDNSFNFLTLKKDFLTLKKKYSYNMLLKFILAKQMYVLNIFLWKLSFFSTSAEASYYINNNFILVNGNKVGSNYFLRLGDIIHFCDISFMIKLKKNLNKYKFFFKLYSFVEIDYFSNSIVVVKNYNDFILDDLSILFSKSININNVSNLLK